MTRTVTVDTGGPDDVFVGALVTWMHTPRGGYGYTMPVDAVVLSHGRRPSTRVTIEVEKARSGEKAKRHVQAANLRWRSR
jgi:hypothetical protein